MTKTEIYHKLLNILEEADKLLLIELCKDDEDICKNFGNFKREGRFEPCNHAKIDFSDCGYGCELRCRYETK